MWNTRHLLQAVAVIALAKSVVSQNLRATPNETGERELQRVNHGVCEEILDTWWGKRVEDIITESTGFSVAESDQVCNLYSGNAAMCASRNEGLRSAYLATQGISGASSDTLKKPCAMLGAGSDLCVSNPCNHLNDKTCTLQLTGGLCNWYSKEDAANHGSKGVEYGCYRNPCHIGGTGKQSDEVCEARGIEGFIQCTYCRSRGTGAGRIKGSKMGCQRTEVTTEAECAPINDGIVDSSTIFQVNSQTRCQCSTETPLCTANIDAAEGSRDGGYTARYPSAVSAKTVEESDDSDYESDYDSDYESDDVDQASFGF